MYVAQEKKQEENKVMVCARYNNKITNITLSGDKSERVQEFCYPGTAIPEDGRNKTDLIEMIYHTKRAFACKKNLLMYE